MREGIAAKWFSAPEHPGPRDNNFNLIRFVAAMMVIYGHMCYFLDAPVALVFGQEVSLVGVKVFMAISGYLVTRSFLQDSNALRYGLRRALRLMPGLIVLTLLSVFIFGPLLSTLPAREYFSNPVTWDYLKNMLLSPRYFLPGVFAENPYANAVNGSLWTLPAEAFLYLLAPLLVWVFHKLRILKLGLIACAGITLAVSIVQMTFSPDLRIVVYGSNLPDWASLFAFFFMGSLYNLPRVQNLLNLQLAVFLVAIFVMLQISRTKGEFCLTLILPYFIFSLALVPRPVFSKWFAKNDYSYGTYLYGFLVQQTVVMLLGPRSLNLCFVISAVVTVILAILSWHLVEKPAQKLGRRLLGTKTFMKWKKAPIEL